MKRRDLLGLFGAQAAAVGGLARVAGAEATHRCTDDHAADSKDPASIYHLYLCAFHVAKKDPGFAVEAHHYCSPVGDALHQCLIYDRRGANGKLIGIEYIVPDSVFRGFPAEEQKFWHPHSYEILAGQLIAPMMSPAEQDKMFEGLITSWGKTWHTWPDPRTDFPMGDALLMWSATRDGMISEEMLAKRDQQFGVSTAEIRKRRSYMGKVPQIDPPANLNSPGRQFTNHGPDVPPK